MKIQTAVLTEKGWEDIPESLRQRADTPWFKSVLAFDPARIAPKIRMPVLLLHGEKDRQVLPYHAENLDAAFRKGTNRQIERRMLPADNHLFIEAKTGEVEEYLTLKHEVDRTMLQALGDWLAARLQPTPR